MNERKYTPGPWTSEYEFVFGPDGHSKICRIDDCSPIEDGLLIAAAPDLLEACQRAVLALKFGSEHFPSMRDDYTVVCAAIAKATGGGK